MITRRRLEYELVKHVVGPATLRFDTLRGELKRRKKKPRPDSPFGPPLEAAHKLKELMSLHYLAGRYADGAVPVAWVTSGFPVEFLRPFGFHAVYPENHAALCSAQKQVPELASAAEAEGYATDLCSYARCDLGSAFSGKTPVGRLPKPDLLCCCTNICQTLLYWYRALATHFNVPLVLIDPPFVYGKAKPHHHQYILDQMEELLAEAARVSRKQVSLAELVEVMHLAREGTALWGECLDASRNRPAPWTGFDGFVHIGPIVALRGTKECNAYYRLLRDELHDRVKKGIGGIKNERHRLMWDNLPIWYGLRELSTLLAERGFNFVCTSYTNAWAEGGALVDPSQPMASMARAYSHVLLNQDLKNRLSVLERLARTYEVEGAVLHSDRSCKPYSVGQIDLKDRLQKALGIRVLLFEADHADPRAYAKEPAENRLTAFLESFA